MTSILGHSHPGVRPSERRMRGLAVLIAWLLRAHDNLEDNINDDTGLSHGYGKTCSITTG